MNLLEHYIIEVQAVKEYENWIVAKVLCDCWGNKRIVEHTATKPAWKKELEQGWFLA
jgi:hypothetical protein